MLGSHVGTPIAPWLPTRAKNTRALELCAALFWFPGTPLIVAILTPADVRLDGEGRYRRLPLVARRLTAFWGPVMCDGRKLREKDRKPESLGRDSGVNTTVGSRPGIFGLGISLGSGVGISLGAPGCPRGLFSKPRRPSHEPSRVGRAQQRPLPVAGAAQGPHGVESACGA